MPMNFDPESLLLSIRGLLDEDSKKKLSHLGNALSLLKGSLPEKAWVGIYWKDENADRLLLGPFQGTPACEEIPVGKGVVGVCFEQRKTIVVEDVHLFPGYICCDPVASSEICVPLFQGEKPVGVLDIDYPKGFTPKGEEGFYEALAEILEKLK